MAIIVLKKKKKKKEDSTVSWIFIYKLLYVFKQLPQINDILSNHKMLQLSLTSTTPPHPNCHCSSGLYCTDWNG